VCLISSEDTVSSSGTTRDAVCSRGASSGSPGDSASWAGSYDVSFELCLEISLLSPPSPPVAALTPLPDV
jgi:hypothetical protein